MKRTVPLAAGVCLVLIAVVGAYLIGGDRSVRAEPASPVGSGVVVDGRGLVTGAPDVLRLQLGVSGSGADVSAALGVVNARMARVRASLGKAGVKAADIQTSNVSIYPETTKRGRRYQVSEQLMAKLRRLAVAGRTISDAVAAGGAGISLDGVSFSLEDDAALLDKARDRAFADARKKAERYAQLAGKSLGDVQVVSESTQSPPVAWDSFKRVSLGLEAAATPVPLYAGTSDVVVVVTVRWALS